MSSSNEVCPSAVVVDADNTLWDTNAVFEDARRRMLSVLVDGPFGNRTGGVDGEYRAVFRQLAGRLSLITGQNDLAVLARGMAVFLSDQGPTSEEKRVEWAAQRVQNRRIPEDDSAAEACIQAAAESFQAALRTPPPLLDGAELLLRNIRDWTTAHPEHRWSVLFSEGAPDRWQFAFEAHEIERGDQFDSIVLREKTPAAFGAVWEGIEDALASPADESHVVTIGDSLKRDIQPANNLGWTTIYCPGDFKGHETPATESEAPDYTVSSLHEALDLLRL
jgi:putative hydrolase of the HAD superfamily